MIRIQAGHVSKYRAINLRKLTLEREESKQGNIFCPLFTLCQLCEDQESPPLSSHFSHSNTLQPNSQRIQIALRNRTSLHHPNRSFIFEAKIDPRSYDTRREDPFRDVKRDFGLDCAGPLVEC